MLAHLVDAADFVELESLENGTAGIAQT